MSTASIKRLLEFQGKPVEQGFETPGEYRRKACQKLRQAQKLIDEALALQAKADQLEG